MKYIELRYRFDVRTQQQNLIQLLTRQNSDLHQEALTVLKNSNPAALANIFVDVAFIITGIRFIQEQYWLQSKEKSDEIQFAGFVKKLLKVELVPLLFFHASLENSSIQEIEQFRQNAMTIQKATVNHAKTLIFPDNKLFATTAMKLMSELFEFEYQLQMDKKSNKQDLGYSLFRTFDILDEVFNLDYKAEAKVNQSGEERLYEMSGATVQSSYSTMLLALRYLRIPTGSRFVDLGAGFGRVGLTIGLLRPDIDFTGYEFVAQRVNIATAASKNLSMDKHVHFFTQDLAVKDFTIPDAETYYMYDPFTEETYNHILAQLNVIGARKKINVITSGSARHQLQKIEQKSRWSKPQEFDGNFCLFRSN